MTSVMEGIDRHLLRNWRRRVGADEALAVAVVDVARGEHGGHRRAGHAVRTATASFRPSTKYGPTRVPSWNGTTRRSRCGTITSYIRQE